jgi:HAD superfamily hydrolase (TIGR01509 family)
MSMRAVLFDFDGVIADTENLHIAAWERTLYGMGWEFPPELIARSAEFDDRAFLTDLFAKKSLAPVAVEGWVARKQELMVRMLDDSPRVYPGVPELVHRLTSLGMRLAVVSTTWRANIEVVLRASGLQDAFMTVVAKEDNELPKPHPAPYQLGASRLRVAARRAVALEDSPTGISSARGAGVAVVAVGHRRPEGEWTNGAPFVPDLRDTDAVIKALGI